MNIINPAVAPKIKQHARQLGANAVEYALVLAIIVGLMITASQAMRPGIHGYFDGVGQKMLSLVNGKHGDTSNNTATTSDQAKSQSVDDSSILGDIWNGTVTIVSFTGSVLYGAGEGLWDLGAGVVNLGSDLVRAPFSQEVRDKYAQTGSAIIDDPSLILDAIVAPIADDWEQGNYGEAIGRSAFEVASILVAPSKVAKLGKLDEVTSVTKVTDDAAELANLSRKLPDDLAGTFAGGRYSTRVLEKDLILYRAGTADQPLGQFFSKDRPISEIQARIDKAILPQWPGGAKSPIDTVFEIKIPAGTTIHTGKVGSQGGFYVGGTQQVVIEKPWLIEGVEVIGSYAIN